jgi:hypothetical protein
MLNRSDLSPPLDRPRSVANLRKYLRPIIVAWPAAGLVIGLATNTLVALADEVIE